jgi:type IV secretion system protein VirB10
LSEVKRAGRIKGKSELYLRFDSLTLPNGVTRDFRARLGADENNSVDRKEGKVVGDSGKGQDAKTIAEATAAGTGIGVLAGSAAGHLGMGAGIGAAAGALGGLAGVLATRGPDAVLQKGSTVEMILDRDLVFAPDEVPSRPSVR